VKGYRFEHRIERFARAQGHTCRRIPLSGAAPGWAGDLLLDGRLYEVKCEARGFRRLYRWLNQRDGVIVGADRQTPLIVLRLNDYLTFGSRPKKLPRPYGTKQADDVAGPPPSRPVSDRGNRGKKGKSKETNSIASPDHQEVSIWDQIRDETSS